LVFISLGIKTWNVLAGKVKPAKIYFDSPTKYPPVGRDDRPGKTASTPNSDGRREAANLPAGRQGIKLFFESFQNTALYRSGVRSVLYRLVRDKPAGKFIESANFPRQILGYSSF
jgi:hypothetical protein